MNDLGMRSAAIHEAGHVVISHALGCIVNKAEIHYGSERQRWEGSYGHKLAETVDFFQIPVLLEKGAKVSVAGVLAQAKYLLCEAARQPAFFSARNDIGAWVSLFRSRKQKDSIPGELNVLFALGSPEGQEQNQLVDGSFFGGADAGPFIQCLEQLGNADPVRLIQTTMDLLDREGNWQAVIRVADAICSQAASGHDQRRQMSRETILPLLNGIVG